jgi:hypothetical protein
LANESVNDPPLIGMLAASPGRFDGANQVAVALPTHGMLNVALPPLWVPRNT